mgnify:CR=1 FL=1
MKSIWSDEEVKSLFNTVEEKRGKGESLKNAFSMHAQKFHRKGNSVRNYYYHEVDNLQKDDARRTRLNIDLKKHIKNRLVPFSKEQEEKFLSEVKALTDKGMSVRSACFKLSNGDMTLMTRLQNKFQNLKKEKAEKKDNIITFKSRKTLTDADINSLFAGLVKLVKKNAYEEVNVKIKEEKETSEYLLKEAYLELNKKEKEINKLKDELNMFKGRKKQDLLKAKLKKGKSLMETIT